jgi:hypothetical protein
MRWEGFGKDELSNPNYRNQITGYQDNGKAGYLRVSYGHNNYEEAISPFFWNWDLKKSFTNEVIKKFEEVVNNLSDKEKNFKKELLAFAELGKKLNKQGKKPRVIISY